MMLSTKLPVPSLFPFGEELVYTEQQESKASPSLLRERASKLPVNRARKGSGGEAAIPTLQGMGRNRR